MCLSCVLSIIPNTITNHYELEKLILRRSEIVEITDSFNIAEVEYHKLHIKMSRGVIMCICACV